MPSPHRRHAGYSIAFTGGGSHGAYGTALDPIFNCTNKGLQRWRLRLRRSYTLVLAIRVEERPPCDYRYLLPRAG